MSTKYSLCIIMAIVAHFDLENCIRCSSNRASIVKGDKFSKGSCPHNDIKRY